MPFYKNNAKLMNALVITLNFGCRLLLRIDRSFLSLYLLFHR